MDDRLRKTERLIKIWLLLYQNPLRFTARDIAEKFGVDVRTIYRDLDALQSELGVPISEEGSKRGIAEGYHLPPIRFSLPEALNIFLSARLMLSYAYRYDPNMEATFFKLNAVTPSPLREQIQKTMDWMHTLPRDERYLRTLAELARAWAEQRRVIITYRAYDAEKAIERTIEPYFIEPAAVGHASYVVAYCHYAGAIRNFRIGRIESLRVTDETYTIPADFDANKYFGPAWGVSVEGEVKTVRLRFSRKVARLAEETVWHPSQVLERRRDGSLVMTLRVMDTIELFRWILSWGQDVKVLEPPEIRKAVMETAEAVREVYMKKRKK
jgi:predicted DNA-binding transcriptional regulator YafY